MIYYIVLLLIIGCIFNYSTFIMSFINHMIYKTYKTYNEQFQNHNDQTNMLKNLDRLPYTDIDYSRYVYSNKRHVVKHVDNDNRLPVKTDFEPKRTYFGNGIPLFTEDRLTYPFFKQSRPKQIWDSKISTTCFPPSTYSTTGKCIVDDLFTPN